MQVQQTQEIACPTCEETLAVPVPDEDVELKARPYVAAFGDYTTVECSSEHTVWVYFC
ncbi:hypothetical protein G6M89_03370 [Natronolimnobius sp. AArcel1]|uniref:hypothetical protein n=1 Tax=Natronolimnobius sp. AArcel1 TaxID=1679093 RepID=UPI0013EC8DCC|nr:hypothetical protein [Natronolimnobius sp. AArcel1]NGM68061.1 hypothetical protein [Natronolimnobius sp. AArcel1]